MMDILKLEHADRQRFVDQISEINRQMNGQSEPGGYSGGSGGVSIDKFFGVT